MPNKKLIYVLLWILPAIPQAFTQDLDYARQQVKTLCSPAFHGRGYVFGGDSIAAQYLAGEFAKFGLEKFGADYFQPYEFAINTFPGDMHVKINRNELIPGVDYLVYPASGSIKGTFGIEVMDSTIFRKGFTTSSLYRQDYSNKFVLIDTLGWGRSRKEFFDLLDFNTIRAAGTMFVSDVNPIFYVLRYDLKYGSLIVKRSALKKKPKTIHISIDNLMINHKAKNIIGFIPGEKDSFLVFTAHYDHLGRMGASTYFPGANDNASGAAMLLDFARAISSEKTKSKYSYAFMLFSGEEAGLLGSNYYTQNPLFPLSKIKMLINLDMVGSGADGVTVFNGSTYPKEYHKIDSLNKTLGLNVAIKPKGISKGSDHYKFHEKNVPVLFFNCNGRDVGYHVVGDNYENLPFTVYEPLFKLIYAYLKTF